MLLSIQWNLSTTGLWKAARLQREQIHYAYSQTLYQTLRSEKRVWGHCKITYKKNIGIWIRTRASPAIPNLPSWTVLESAPIFNVQLKEKQKLKPLPPLSQLNSQKGKKTNFVTFASVQSNSARVTFFFLFYL